MTGAEFVLAARALVGVPYRHQGRTPRGLDCLGLLVLAASRCGIFPLQAGRTDYGRAPLDELLAGLADYCDQVEGDEPGTILAIRWPGDRRAGHVAICAGATMIHSYSNCRRVVEHGFRGKWREWVVSRWWPRGMVRG